MSFDRQLHLIGELLELRPLHEADWPALFEAASDPLVWEQHPDWDRYQEEVFRGYFRDALDSGGALVVLDRSDGSIIGASRYHNHDPEQSRIEIGWTFLMRKYWGGAYNGELKRLMLAHAFKHVATVYFMVGVTNTRSQKAMQKVGVVLAGTRLDRNGREHLVYEILASEYLAGLPQQP